ncbi:hypothetical protein CGZ94_18375 [Enemella evansiae]|uniref:Type IV toxin-antitoxin system AbiEi family antitoxin domain-containing protein n=1 Tax=Enemella evansiae TaxID=2016499 RepID=A0A255G212_9ACTN|nr:type IV toxin-antitoxin system AbiEi family antitoxin domain-containing protein [Enemella evansiae]OYO09621.1 hypothetical protein CGZ94_18375 [Enemella evansiae]
MIETTEQLLARGWSYAEIRQRVRDGALHRLARGSYSDQNPARLNPDERHLQLVTGLYGGLTEGSVLSHASAGVLHGLWLPVEQLTRVHVARPGARDSQGRRVHIHPLPECAVVDPVQRLGSEPARMTDLCTTTLALVSTLELPAAVAVADSALRQGLDRQAALDVVSGWKPRPGRRRARLALEFANERSESAGESRSRWLMHELGLPAPVLQQEFANENGEWIARADFWWPEQGVIGEFDGKVKYGRLLKPGQRIEDIIEAERERERALQNLGHWVTRWTWRTLDVPSEFAKQLRRALARGPR